MVTYELTHTPLYANFYFIIEWNRFFFPMKFKNSNEFDNYNKSSTKITLKSSKRVVKNVFHYSFY